MRAKPTEIPVVLICCRRLPSNALLFYVDDDDHPSFVLSRRRRRRENSIDADGREKKEEFDTRSFRSYFSMSSSVPLMSIHAEAR